MKPYFKNRRANPRTGKPAARIMFPVLALTAAFIASSQDAAAPLQVKIPTIITQAMKEGRQIVDEAVETLGGEKFLALRTKIEKGRFFSFYNQQLSGLSVATVYTKYLIAPEKPNPDELYLRERQAFGKDEKWSVLFNEEDGYEITFRGVRPLPEETVKQFRRNRRNDIFYILLRRLNEEGLVFESRGTEVVDNYPMRKVEIIDGENNSVIAYFHLSSKLPARIVYKWRDKDRIPHEDMVIYDKFREFDGVQLPLVIQRYRDGERSFSMFARTIEVNKPIGEDILGLPTGVKMLERLE